MFGNRGLIGKFCSFVVIFFLIVVAAVPMPGCQTGFFQPAEPFYRSSPSPESRSAPSVPSQIEAGERQEPVISVYIAEKETVEEMNMEEYIAGVVAGEMDPKWPLAALAAQAIIARTFTLQKIDEAGGVPHRDAHASTDVEEFQAYNVEDITDKVREAVRITKGIVACHNNRYIRAWFSAYAGPKTAQADEGLAFNSNPSYIKVVDNPGQDIVPPEEGEWSADFPLEQVKDIVTRATGKDPGPIKEVKIAEYGPSGRAAYFTVNNRKISGTALRLGLGSTEMRSTFVKDISIDGDMLHMSGVGYGHGVGMCQWGARALAEKGNSPEEIINYFFEDIDVMSLWE